MSSDKPADGGIEMFGRLIVDYEIAIQPQGRMVGTVIDRKLLVQQALLPSDPKELKLGYPVTYELHDIDAGPFRFGLSPEPVLGEVLRTEAGLLVTIDVAEA